MRDRVIVRLSACIEFSPKLKALRCCFKSAQIIGVGDEPHIINACHATRGKSAHAQSQEEIGTDDTNSLHF